MFNLTNFWSMEKVASEQWTMLPTVVPTDRIYILAVLFLSDNFFLVELDFARVFFSVVDQIGLM